MMSTLLVWAIVRVPGKNNDFETTMPFLQALAVAACITPTDPVLSNTIVRGRWADRHVPVPMTQLISAESGANDGLGYPFLYLALYLLKYLGTQGYQGAAGAGGSAGHWGGARSAMGMWFGETWGYLVLLGAVWGVFVGWLARRCLKVAVALGYTSQENLYTLTVVISVGLPNPLGFTPNAIWCPNTPSNILLSSSLLVHVAWWAVMISWLVSRQAMLFHGSK